MEKMSPVQKDKRYTYADYVTWPDDARYELIDGEAYMMAGAGTAHQRASGDLHRQFSSFLYGKSCEVFHAPFDVRLNAAGDKDETVVQPDLLVVCDKTKIDAKGCNGAPDMVIEILSSSTASHDTVVKFNKYLQAGVREYWIVNPEIKAVSVHVLENGRYVTSAYNETDTVPVHILDGCQINMRDVFAE